jgi:hypothetical protein
VEPAAIKKLILLSVVAGDPGNMSAGLRFALDAATVDGSFNVEVKAEPSSIFVGNSVENHVTQQWLIEYLRRNGTTKVMDIMEDAQKESISDSTVYRWRRQLGRRIHNTHGWKDPANCWELVERATSDKKGLSDDE